MTKSISLTKVLIAIAVVAVFSFVGVQVVRAAVTVVHPGDLVGWSFVQESGGAGDSAGDFVEGPSTPPAGTGSAHMTLADSGAGIALGVLDYTGLAFADIDMLEYSTYAASTSAGTVQAIFSAV